MLLKGHRQTVLAQGSALWDSLEGSGQHEKEFISLYISCRTANQHSNVTDLNGN